MYHLIRMLPGARRLEIYLKISVFSIGYCVTVLVHYHNLNKAETKHSQKSIRVDALAAAPH